MSSSVHAIACGERTTFSRRWSGEAPGSGSSSNTSSAAPAMAPSASARASAASSTIGPRAVLTR